MGGTVSARRPRILRRSTCLPEPGQPVISFIAAWAGLVIPLRAGGATDQAAPGPGTARESLDADPASPHFLTLAGGSPRWRRVAVVVSARGVEPRVEAGVRHTIVSFCGGDVYGERRSPARLTLHLDVSTCLPDNPVHDGQSQSRSFIYGFVAEERLE